MAELSSSKIYGDLTITGKVILGDNTDLNADKLDGMETSSSNTVSTVVARDSSGNFSAGTITANLSGNASTATKLQTARTINGVGFDGTSNITITDSTKAPLASPALTGTPTAPTASNSDNSSQIATTAFVKAQGYLTAGQAGTVIIVSNTQPSNPAEGNIWIQTF